MLKYIVENDRFGDSLYNPFIVDHTGEPCYTLASYCSMNGRFYIDGDGLYLYDKYDEIKTFIRKYAKAHGVPARVVDTMVKSGASYSPAAKKFYAA